MQLKKRRKVKVGSKKRSDGLRGVKKKEVQQLSPPGEADADGIGTTGTRFAECRWGYKNKTKKRITYVIGARLIRIHYCYDVGVKFSPIHRNSHILKHGNDVICGTFMEG